MPAMSNYQIQTLFRRYQPSWLGFSKITCVILGTKMISKHRLDKRIFTLLHRFKQMICRMSNNIA